MTDIHSLLTHAKEIEQPCPFQQGPPTPILGKHAEIGRRWCRQVAEWTSSALECEETSKFVCRQINWSILALRQGKPACKQYDKLVNLLLEGYALIESIAGSVEEEVAYCVLDKDDNPTDNPTKRPFIEHVRLAQELIKRKMTDPLGHWSYKMFQYDFDATQDPFVRCLLHTLSEARRFLELSLRATEHLLRSKMNPTKMQPFLSPPLMPGAKRTAWQDAYDELDSLLNCREGDRAAPWTWLGANLLGFALPPVERVFEYVDLKKQQCARVRLTSGGLGPAPSFVSVLFASMQQAEEALRTHAEKAIESHRRQDTRKIVGPEYCGDIKMLGLPGGGEPRTPYTDTRFMWQDDAAYEVGCVPSTLSKRSTLPTGQPDHLRSWEYGNRRFYFRADIDKLRDRFGKR